MAAHRAEYKIDIQGKYFSIEHGSFPPSGSPASTKGLPDCSSDTTVLRTSSQSISREQGIFSDTYARSESISQPGGISALSEKEAANGIFVYSHKRPHEKV